MTETRMRRFVGAKIHEIRVTGKSVRYVGSVSICPRLMDAAGIEPFEEVQVVNLNNGERWYTYALAGRPGEFLLNGGGARLGEIEDHCVVMTYISAPEFPGANVIFCDANNEIMERLRYG